MDRLYDKLIAYNRENYYPMHMPGHKRNIGLMQMDNPYLLDITEIDGFDNLHQAKGIIKQLNERIRSLYGAKRSFLLVNGSTAGILAGICAAAGRGDKVLVARNCHRSVYHALVLKGLTPIYYYPQQIGDIPVNGGISAVEIEDLLIKNSDVTLVVITSPTYEGVVSDINQITEVVHRHGAFLMVDEAHGAHFGFHGHFPQSAVSFGADLVIQSLHKTLPAFTQTAVLHTNRPELYHKIEQYLSVYQTSSPSYLLMAGADRCVSMLEEHGRELFDAYDKRLEQFYHRMVKLERMKLLTRNIAGAYDVYDLDPSKITISVRGTSISGHQLQQLLRERYHIEMEMEAPEYVLGMTSICDTGEGFDRLADALLAIDREIAVSENKEINHFNENLRPIQVLLPQEAFERRSERIKLYNSEGRVSACFVSMFPPGSPLLVPGELISSDMIHLLHWVREEQISITGLSDEDEIVVVVP